VRVEIIRFSLLITITIAAISIAVRHGGSHHDTTAGSRSQSPSASASAGGTPAAGTSGGSANGGTATGGTSGGQSTGGHNHGSQGTSGGSSGTSGGSTGAQSTQMLPRTGSTQVAELGGLAVLLIAAGSFSMTVSRRSTR
jgi:hypothetical protein